MNNNTRENHKSFLLPKLLLYVFLIFIFSIVPQLTHTEEEVTKKHIGIIEPASHPAFDEILFSMKEELGKLGLTEGREITFTLFNAGGDANKFSVVAQSALSAGVNLVVVLATPTARAAVNEIGGRLPIVFSAVTDPVGAGIVESLNKPGDNITGVSDAWPYKSQLQLIRNLGPKIRHLGVIYNPAEENSVFGMDQIKKLAPRLEFEIIERTVANEGEVASAAASLLGNIDAFFIISDNVAVAQAPVIIKAGLEHNLPVFAGDSGTVQKGAVAAASVGYDGVGRETAKLVKRILAGEPAGTIPVIVTEGDDIHLNLDSAASIKMSIPKAVLNSAKKTYGTGELTTGGKPSIMIWLIMFGIIVVIIVVLVGLRRKSRTQK